MSAAAAVMERHETAQEWAQRVLAEHGPPPQLLVDKARAIATTAADRTT